jgi:hypothetical protein
MDGAATYSRELLQRYDDARSRLQEEEVTAHSRPRSGRFVSSQPYGVATESNDMDNAGQSDALIRLQRESKLVSDYPMDKEAHTAYKTPSLFPASSVSGPGENGARQIATLQARLAQRLGPEYISTRQGPGGGEWLRDSVSRYLY